MVERMKARDLSKTKKTNEKFVKKAKVQLGKDNSDLTSTVLNTPA
jgi:hypothetical protein